ncbi:MAG: hypothetical protein F9K49_08700, partial [Caedimonadaceae bacterium]
MILTDYYKGEKLKENKAQYRFEVTQSTSEYNLLQRLLENKRKPNVGGLSFNFVPRSTRWGGGEVPDNAITKGSDNITSVYIP